MNLYLSFLYSQLAIIALFKQNVKYLGYTIIGLKQILLTNSDKSGTIESKVKRRKSIREKMYQEILTKAGFDPKETKVYLAGLELGSAPASAIAEKAGIVRSTSYGILEELVHKGLASKTERSGVLWFNIDSPELIKDYIKAQKEDLDTVEEEIDRLLPQLKKIQKEFGFKPEIEIFEGAKGLAAAMKSTIADTKRMAKNNIPILINGQTANMVEVWPEFPEFAMWRAKSGVKIKMFISDARNDFVDPQMAAIRDMHYKIKTLPDKYIYTAGANLFDEKIMLVDFDQLVTVIIKNKPLVEMMRNSFEFMWDFAEKS